MIVKLIVMVCIVLFVLLIFGLASIALSVFSMKKSIWKGTRSRPDTNKAKTHSTATGKKKIIPQDEGEYVDFEEV